MMKLVVNVTKDDIKKGKRQDASGASGGCMIYRAFVRATEGAFRHVWVGSYGIDFDDGVRPMGVNLSREVHDKILAFDNGDPTIKPFSFELDLPE